jgi:hypothetical protein
MFRSAWAPFLLRSAALTASPRSLRRVVPVAKQLASIHPGVKHALPATTAMSILYIGAVTHLVRVLGHILKEVADAGLERAT